MPHFIKISALKLVISLTQNLQHNVSFVFSLKCSTCYKNMFSINRIVDSPRFHKTHRSIILQCVTSDTHDSYVNAACLKMLTLELHQMCMT